MSSSLTVTLSPDMAEQVSQLAEEAQTEAETIVTEALRAYLAQVRSEKSGSLGISVEILEESRTCSGAASNPPNKLGTPANRRMIESSGKAGESRPRPAGSCPSVLPACLHLI